MTRRRDLPQLADIFAEAFTRAKATDPERALERALETLFAIDDENHRLEADEGLPLQLVVAARPKKSRFTTGTRSSAQLWLPLIEQVAHQHGLTLRDLTGPSRVRAISSVRHEAMWLLTMREHVSQEITASALNRRDHSCVFYGVQKFEARLAAEPLLRARMGDFRKAA